MVIGFSFIGHIGLVEVHIGLVEVHIGLIVVAHS